MTGADRETTTPRTGGERSGGGAAGRDGEPDGVGDDRLGTPGGVGGPAAAPPAPRRPRARRRRRSTALLEAAIPFLAWLIAGILRLLKATTRRRLVGAERLLDHWTRREPVILAFWHEQLVMMPFAYRGPRACIMVSRHRDGELIARAVRPLGIVTVRGSSTRGWSGGLKSMLRVFRQGADLAFAPDGPRGPRYVAKSGVLQVARVTGAPIFPIAAAARWSLRVGSWDRLIIPFVGSRIVYAAGAPLRVARDATADELERARATLEHELTRLTRDTRAAVGVPPPSDPADAAGAPKSPRAARAPSLE